MAVASRRPSAAASEGGRTAAASKLGGGSKAIARRTEKMSVKVLLAQAGLQDFYPFFEKSDYQMLDANFHPSDLQVEQILADVERNCGRRFPPEIRIRLWKVLRHMWFRGAGHEDPYIERDDVPRLFLPKRDYKHIDWMTKFSELDPDRQRQIVRKTRHIATKDAGPRMELLQFEVYRRQRDIWYEFKDVQRCVEEWQRENPRTMLREDPREEVLKIRIRNIIDRCNGGVMDRNAASATQRLILHILMGIRLITAAMAVLMFVTAYMRFRNSPREIMVHFLLGCKQFTAGISYVIAFVVAWVVAQHRRDDPLLLQFKRLIISSERLQEQLSEFRIESEELRMTGTEMPKASDLQVPRAVLPAQRKARDLKRRKRKKPKDPTLMLWAPELMKNKEDMGTIRQALPACFKNLEPLPDNFRRDGGDRMWRFTDRLGNRLAGVNEDALVQRVIGRREDQQALLDGGFQLPELPYHGSQAALPELPNLPELPMPPSRLPDAAMRTLPGPAPLGPMTPPIPSPGPTPMAGTGAGSGGGTARARSASRTAREEGIAEDLNPSPDSLHPWVAGHAGTTLPGFSPPGRISSDSSADEG